MSNKKWQVESNAFDLLRLYAALSVMLLHFTGFFLMLSKEPNRFMENLRKVTLLFPGVVILFSISGFLIAYSYEKSDGRRNFFQKRILRLYPELWACTLVNLVVLIVLAREKLDRSILPWILTQIVGIANTPSCLKDFATGSVNGALWTIFVEIQLYVLVLIFYPWLKKLAMAKWCVLLFVFAGVNLVCGWVNPYMGSTMQKILERTFLPYLFWFLAGVFCYCKRECLLPFLRKYSLLLLVIYVVLYRFTGNAPGYYCGIATSAFCPFFTVGIGFLLPKMRFKQDLSYGLFLYHWIVLNIIVCFDLFNRLPWYLCMLLFIGVSGILSWLSVRLIGNRMKKYKGKKY